MSLSPQLIISSELVCTTIESIESAKFSDVTKELRRLLCDRLLTVSEKTLVTNSIREYSRYAAEYIRSTDRFIYTDMNSMHEQDDVELYQILIVTAYSTDYTIGDICSQINRNYAKKHGYEFYSRVLTLSELGDAILPKKHCTWYKILLLKELFSDKKYLRSKGIRYVMWIDADALVIDSTVSLQDIVVRGENKDLIIAEDMNPSCLLNCGVFLLRTTQWNATLLDNVWNSERYNDTTYYEQSAMIRYLRSVNEGLESVVPFHSYSTNSNMSPYEISRSSAVKHFAHVAVFPCRELNTNRGVTSEEVAAYKLKRRTAEANSKKLAETCSNIVAIHNDNNKNISNNSNSITVNETATTASINSSPADKSANYSTTLVMADSMADSPPVTVSNKSTHDNSNNDSNIDAQFIYHVAGLSDKLSHILAAIDKYRVEVDTDILQELKPFNLKRGKNGQILSKELIESRKIDM